MTNFPTTLDTFNNPTAGTPQNAVGFEHDLQHANLNDAVRALQSKVGANNSGVATSLDYRVRQVEQNSGVISVNGQTGAVTLTSTGVTEGSNLYFTNARARSAVSAVAPISYISSTGVFSLAAATGSVDGYLAHTDWSIFNSKQAALGFAPLDKAGSNSMSATLNIAPANNTSALHVSGYSLGANNVQPLLDMAGTWNTTGLPTAIKLNITDTASSLYSVLMDLQVGGTSVFKVDKRSVLTVTYIQNAQGQLTLSGDSGNLYLYYPASGCNSLIADTQNQILSFNENGSNQPRVQIMAYSDVVFFDSTNGNQPCFTVRGNGSGVDTHGGNLIFGGTGNTFFSQNNEETIELQVNSTGSSAISFLTGEATIWGVMGCRAWQTMFFNSSPDNQGFTFETNNTGTIAWIDNSGNVAFGLGATINGAFNLQCPDYSTQFNIVWDSPYPRIYMGNPGNGLGDADAVFNKLSSNGAADFYLGEDADHGGTFLRGQGAFGIGTQASSSIYGLWISAIGSANHRKFGFNTLAPLDVVQINGQGTGASGASGQMGWWNQNGSHRMGLLQDNGSGVYGVISLFGDSTSSSLIGEFDVMDRHLTGDIRVFIFAAQTDSNAGGYAATFNPRSSGGSFVNNQLYINANGVGIATNNPACRLHVAGTIRVDNATSAPTTHTTPSFSSYYGNNTKALGDPNNWLLMNVGGTNYKIPLYS